MPPDSGILSSTPPGTFNVVADLGATPNGGGVELELELTGLVRDLKRLACFSLLRMNLPSPAMKALFLNLKKPVQMKLGSLSRRVMRRKRRPLVSTMPTPLCCFPLQPPQKGNGINLPTFVRLWTTSSMEGRRDATGETHRPATSAICFKAAVFSGNAICGSRIASAFPCLIRGRVQSTRLSGAKSSPAKIHSQKNSTELPTKYTRGRLSVANKKFKEEDEGSD